jgi:hypothetical protein
MFMRALRAVVAAAALVSLCAFAANMPSGKPEYMLVGIDNKVVFADDGSVQLNAPGNDLVAIFDIGTDPENPKLVAKLGAASGSASGTRTAKTSRPASTMRAARCSPR